MVRNVAEAPASSVEKDDPRSLSSKYFPMKEPSTFSLIDSMNFIFILADCDDCQQCRWDEEVERC